jgi:hypothetical protein
MSSQTSRIPTPHAVPAQPPAPGRRWRVWIVLGAISIGWKVLVFTVGAAVPRWLITDGIAQLPAPLQDYGREAKRTALTLWDGPIERHGLVRTVRVMSVHTSDSGEVPRAVGAPTSGSGSSSSSSAADSASAGGCDGHGAVVRAYTYFGIPYSEARTRCDSGVVEYRVFRRRKSETP